MINFSKEIINLALNKKHNCNQIVLMCSSGVDSISMTDYFFRKLSRNNTYNNIPITLLHFNHDQRTQNTHMESSVNNFMRDKNIVSTVMVNLKKLIKNPTEDGMRKARIEWIKNNINNSMFITAHHLDDMVESYLLNTIRGKEGFLPMPFYTEVDTNIICRPFMFTEKKDFIEYAERNDLMKYVVEDETNYQTKGSRRNFMRNEIIPLLNREKIGMRTVVKKKIQERLFSL